MNSIFCITGMHRSGTSLLMSWLESCGLQISDGGLVPDGTGNITGHFEDQEFVELHLKTISKAIPGSKGWIVTNKHDLGKLSLDHKDMTDILITRNKRYPLWGWKDPRTILFISRWKECIPDLKTIFIWRPCIEVINSLIRRANQSNKSVLQISRWQAMNLWKLSNKLLINFHKEHPEETIVTSLQNLIDNDYSLFEYINKIFPDEFIYNPISRIYDRSWIHREENFVSTFIVNLDPQINKITKRLIDISFCGGQ